MSAVPDGQFGSSRSIKLTVDGEHWEVIARDRQFDFNWLRGAVEPYGFSSRLSSLGATPSVEQTVEMIREFMSNVNPETGYLD